METELDYRAVAIEALVQLGLSGALAAQLELARRYEAGDGVRTWHREARRWYQRAADSGHVPSMRALYDRLIDCGEWHLTDDLRDRLVAVGDPAALRDQALALSASATNQAERDEGEALLQEAARAGDGEAARHVAMQVLLDEKPDRERALALLGPALARGEHMALELAAELEGTVFCLAYDAERERDAWLEAAEQGSTFAMLTLADFLAQDAPGVARRWLERAIAAKDLRAHLALARLELAAGAPAAARQAYSRGPGDLDPALDFKIAVANGEREAYALESAEAGVLAAQLFWADHSTHTGDYPRAAAWLKQAALSGDMEAMARWGAVRLGGLGCPMGAADALFWLRRATRLGSVQAPVDLVQCLYRGGLDAAASPEALAELEQGLYVLAARRGNQVAIARLGQTAGSSEQGRALFGLSAPDGPGARELARLLAEEGLPPPTAHESADALAALAAGVPDADAIDALLDSIEQQAAELEAEQLAGRFGPEGMPPDGPAAPLVGTRLVLARPGGFTCHPNGFVRMEANASLVVTCYGERMADLVGAGLVDGEELAPPAGLPHARLTRVRLPDHELHYLLLDAGEQRLCVVVTYHPDAASTLGARLLAVLAGAYLAPELALPPDYELCDPVGFSSSFSIDPWCCRRFIHPTHRRLELPFGLALALEPLSEHDAAEPLPFSMLDGLPDRLALHDLDVGRTFSTQLDGRTASSRAGRAVAGYQAEPVHFCQHTLRLGTQRLTVTAIAPEAGPEQLEELLALLDTLRWTPGL